jgi:hypothetical protein
LYKNEQKDLEKCNFQSSFKRFWGFFACFGQKIMKNFSSDYQCVKRKMKVFFQKYLVGIKKGCIFALANKEKEF